MLLMFLLIERGHLRLSLSFLMGSGRAGFHSDWVSFGFVQTPLEQRCWDFPAAWGSRGSFVFLLWLRSILLDCSCWLGKDGSYHPKNDTPALT